jgi:ribA/ribD-fused uncharacterized protein
MKDVYYINVDREVCLWSNFAKIPVVVGGLEWPTSEHYFQAAKFFTTDPEWAKAIRLSKTPAAAKKMGNNRSHTIDSEWDKGKSIEEMLKVLFAKAAQNKNAVDGLLSTGNSMIVERADWDPKWGDGKNRNGTNFLGRLCMIVRDVMKASR